VIKSGLPFSQLFMVNGGLDVNSGRELTTSCHGGSTDICAINHIGVLGI
jgi:hypothetical protein